MNKREKQILKQEKNNKTLCMSETMRKDLTSVVTGFPEEKKDCCGDKICLKEVENFLNLVKDIKIQFSKS